MSRDLTKGFILRSIANYLSWGIGKGKMILYMVMKMERMERGYTGGLLEVDMFGERFRKRRGGPGEYKKYEEALKEVKVDYPGDPSDPRERFASDLHAEVAQELGLEDWSELRLYSAVGSSLDYYHGVDAFFEWRDQRVTMDVTRNPAKESGYKADVILGEEEFELPQRRLEKAIEIAEILRAGGRRAAVA